MNQDDRYHTTSWDGRQAQSRPSGGEGQRAQSRPASTGKKKSKKKKKRTNPLLAILLWLVIVASSSAILAGVGWKLANDFAALNKGTKEDEVEVTISEDWVVDTKISEKTGKEIQVFDMDKVAEELSEKGLVEYPWFFKLFNKFYHGNEKIVAGTFTLNKEMDYMALIRSMKSTGKAETVDISIPEGYNVQQIIDLLAEKGVASKEDLVDAAANYPYEDYAFLDKEKVGSISRLEGYLYPDTYNFYVGGKAAVALDSMLSNFNSKVYANEDLSPLIEEAAAKGYGFDKIINIASLIEKETDGSDRSKIASVIYNRLENAGETAYLLQIDAALVYAAGRPITQADYSDLNSPYNLYKNTGLPPTPIANPGLASIKAALQPEDTDYYFYVLGAEGKHVFSETLAEHQKAVANAG